MLAQQREQSIATKLRATGLEGKAVRREEPAASFRLLARALIGLSGAVQRLYDQRQRSVVRCLGEAVGGLHDRALEYLSALCAERS